MSRARLNGIGIDYAVSGGGPPVLLSHGYSATRRMWDGQHRALDDAYQVISWSMRGHGQTESPSDASKYSAELTVADMEALLRERHKGKFFMCLSGEKSEECHAEKISNSMCR